jgi:hypothetical protein
LAPCRDTGKCKNKGKNERMPDGTLMLPAWNQKWKCKKMGPGKERTGLYLSRRAPYMRPPAGVKGSVPAETYRP